MAKDSVPLSEHLSKLAMEGDVDLLREGIAVLTRALMELEPSQQASAGRHERSKERRTQRNGYRERVGETRVGEIPL